MPLPPDPEQPKTDFPTIPMPAGTRPERIQTDSGNMNGASLMQLPFPPGMDRNDLNLKPAAPLITMSNPNISFNITSQDGSGFQPKIRNKNVSITRDLPMPPGKFLNPK
jgi:hypothetical protein